MAAAKACECVCNFYNEEKSEFYGLLLVLVFCYSQILFEFSFYFAQYYAIMP